MSTIAVGIFSIGFVFGYLLYYAVKHTEKFNIELLSSALGTIGSGALIGRFADQYKTWLGPYGLGIGIGFLFYLVLALVLSFIGPSDGSLPPVMMLRKTLLGSQG